MLPEIVVGEPAELAERLARRLAEQARRAIATRGFFAIALPGGSLANAFFPRLARLALDWTRVEFFWGDERAVPASDPESNYALARSLWLAPAKVPSASIHRMAADAPDQAAAAAAYEGELLRVLGAPARLDLALLGSGPDGHVASLFPGHRLLREERQLVAFVDDAPKPPPRRMTLTLPALAASELLVVAALGGAKAEIVRQALAEPDSALPLALVLRRARRAVLLLDPEAARLI